MKNLLVKGIEHDEAGLTAPLLEANVVNKTVFISGQAYGYDSQKHCQPLMEWLEEYCKTPGQVLTINFKLNYFNTAYSKRFVEMLHLLEAYQDFHQGQVTVNWYYLEDDPDMLEEGEEYQHDVDLPIHLIAYS